MSSIEPTRYEDGRPMLLGGLRRHHAMADTALRATWDAIWHGWLSRSGQHGTPHG